jgi:hypothetical protein
MRAKPTAETWVPLAQVRLGERRARSLSAATVERYRQWLEQGREAPAVRLVRHGDEFVVRDGRHRVAAALAAGHLDIKAVVRRIAGLPVTLITRLCRRSRAAAHASLARFDRGRRAALPRGRLNTRLRSVNGKHAPFVRPRCGFDSCRRLHSRP